MNLGRGNGFEFGPLQMGMIVVIIAGVGLGLWGDFISFGQKRLPEGVFELMIGLPNQLGWVMGNKSRVMSLAFGMVVWTIALMLIWGVLYHRIILPIQRENNVKSMVREQREQERLKNQALRELPDDRV
jgi:hypothetical protein